MILQVRAGGATQRCHTIRHHGSYSVAEHSWGVAMLLLQLYPHDFRRLVQFALVHDVPEGLTGDIPSTAKNGDESLDDAILKHFGLPLLSWMGDRERAILKSCDLLDLFLWAREQMYMGNDFALEITKNLQASFNQPVEKSSLEPTAYNFYPLSLKGKGCVPDRVGLLKRIKDGSTTSGR